MLRQCKESIKIAVQNMGQCEQKVYTGIIRTTLYLTIGTCTDFNPFQLQLGDNICIPQVMLYS